MPKFKKIAKRAGRAVVKVAKPVVKAAIRGARNELVRNGRLLLTGMGDYKTNSLIAGSGSTSQMPSFGTTRITIKRREMIQQVISSSTIGGFKLEKLTVNPGINTSFPWLAGIAGVFESWQPNGLVYEYRSTSGTAIGSTNTALGAVILAPQYNSFAVDPTTITQLEGYTDCVIAVPSQDILCGVECNPANRAARALFCRNANAGTGVIGTGNDALFDLCDFYVATSGLQAASVVVGELWVTYSIDLWNPIIPVPPGVPYNYYCATYPITASILTVFDNAPTVAREYGDLLDYASASTLHLKNLIPGQYYMVQIYFFKATGYGATMDPDLSVGVGATAINTECEAPNAGATATMYFCEVGFQVDNPSPNNNTTTVTIGTQGLTQIADNTYVRVFPMPIYFRSEGPALP